MSSDSTAPTPLYADISKCVHLCNIAETCLMHSDHGCSTDLCMSFLSLVAKSRQSFAHEVHIKAQKLVQFWQNLDFFWEAEHLNVVVDQFG